MARAQTADGGRQRSAEPAQISWAGLEGGNIEISKKPRWLACNGPHTKAGRRADGWTGGRVDGRAGNGQRPSSRRAHLAGWDADLEKGRGLRLPHMGQLVSLALHVGRQDARGRQ